MRESRFYQTGQKQPVECGVFPHHLLSPVSERAASEPRVGVTPKGGEKTIITHQPAAVLAHAGRKRAAKFTNQPPPPSRCCAESTTARKQTRLLMECQTSRRPGRGNGHAVRVFVLTCREASRRRKAAPPNASRPLPCITLKSAGSLV